MIGRKTRRSILSVALAMAVSTSALTLGGCAAEEASYDPGAAKQLQSEVLTVSELAAASDFASALLALAELDLSLKDARARNLITEERYASILAAATMVRTDLEAAIAAQTPPPAPPSQVPAPSTDEGDEAEDEGKGNSGRGNNGNGNNGKGSNDEGGGED